MAELETTLAISAASDGLVLSGAIVGSDVTPFRRALDACVERGGFVRLDMREVTSMDVGALRALVSATGCARSRDGDVVLDGLGPEVAALVRASGLSWLLTTIDVSAPSATLEHGVS